MTDIVERLREYGDTPQDVSDGEWAEWSHKAADEIERLRGGRPLNETGGAQLLHDGQLGCYDCGIPYRQFPDLIIDNAAFAKIAPNPPDGGLLCPNCINSRLEVAGLEGVPARFTSGPMARHAAPAPAAGEIEHLRLSLSEARATGRREGLSEAAAIAEQFLEDPVSDDQAGEDIWLCMIAVNQCSRMITSAIRAAMEKEE
ncbi:MAG: hypothetical protein H5U22_06740 [Rhizobium sp.]|nr:hypothetical protein [Rhizobium sp.]